LFVGDECSLGNNSTGRKFPGDGRGEAFGQAHEPAFAQTGFSADGFGSDKPGLCPGFRSKIRLGYPAL
jgi:hypothetical protein